MNRTLCEMCYPNWVELCEFGEYTLVASDQNTYHLMAEPCHKNDNVVDFAHIPRPDPLGEYDLDDEASLPPKTDPRWPLSMDWMKEADDHLFHLGHPVSAHSFVNDMIELGYSIGDDGSAVEYWLFHELGKKLQDELLSKLRL